MTAVQTIETLIKIAMIVKDAHEAVSGKDLKKFLADGGLENVSGIVQQLVGLIDDDDVDAAIQRIAKKQKALLGTSTLADLPTERLIQYLQLGDARVALSAKRVKVAADADFLSWVVDDALPVLGKVAPVVLPLIL